MRAREEGWARLERECVVVWTNPKGKGVGTMGRRTQARPRTALRKCCLRPNALQPHSAMKPKSIPGVRKHVLGLLRGRFRGSGAKHEDLYHALFGHGAQTNQTVHNALNALKKDGHVELRTKEGARTGVWFAISPSTQGAADVVQAEADAAQLRAEAEKKRLQAEIERLKADAARRDLAADSERAARWALMVQNGALLADMAALKKQCESVRKDFEALQSDSHRGRSEYEALRKQNAEAGAEFAKKAAEHRRAFQAELVAERAERAMLETELRHLVDACAPWQSDAVSVKGPGVEVGDVGLRLLAAASEFAALVAL